MRIQRPNIELAQSASQPENCNMADQSQEREAGVKTGMSTRANTRSQAASFVSPPGSKTPPSMPIKRTILYPDSNANRSKPSEGSEPVDASALTKALKDYDKAGRQREITPGTSPCRKRQRVYGDRYVAHWSRPSALVGAIGIEWLDWIPMRLTCIQFHPKSRWSRPTSNLQSSRRGWLSYNAIKIQETCTPLRTSLPKELVFLRGTIKKSLLITTT